MAWLGAGLAGAGCGSVVEVNEEAVRSGEKDVELQAALARFKDARVVGSEGGVPYAVSGTLGRLPEALGGLRAREEALREVVADLAPVFRLEAEELSLRRTTVDSHGHQHLRFQQLHQGLRVVGGELVLHADAERRLYAANGSVRVEGLAPTQARVSPEAARVAAERGSTAQGATAEGEAQRVFLRLKAEGALTLAYEVRVRGEREGMPADDLVYVDAERGDVLRVHPRIHTALNRRLHTASNGTTTPGTLKRTEGQAPVGDTHLDTNYSKLGETYECYKTLFGRDSYDNAGTALTSTVHYGRNYVNAYWDGTQMVYGDGDGVTAGPFGMDSDVTTHELTHAVTERESNLIYQGESGGLNESMSDIFAGVCESWTRNWATDADVFKVGEDIWTPALPGDALRYMDDPVKDTISMDYYTDAAGSVDVHFSSGISNLVFALLSKGGIHPRGKSNNPVPGLGVEKAGRIFYKANTDYFTPDTTFEKAKTYTVQAAEVLYGVGSPEAAAVTEAWKAVGVPQPPPVYTPLSNGVAVSGLNGGVGNRKYYTLEVPAGLAITNLVFEMSGGTGDADMYVKAGTTPTSSSYDCRPYKNGNAESCTFATPQAGTWYVMVHAYTAYTGASLKASYTGGGSGGSGGPSNETLSGAVPLGQNLFHGPYTVVPGTSFKATMTGTSDPDLYVRFGAQPTLTTYHCRPFLTGPNETCTLTVPAGQNTVYLMVRGYKAANYQVVLDYTRP